MIKIDVPHVKKVKVKYEGPDSRILVRKSHTAFTLRDGMIFEANEEDAQELIKFKDKGKKFTLVKETKQTKKEEGS